MTQDQQNPTGMGATEMFRIPSSDATMPDLLGSQANAKPALSIVKGPQTGMTFELSDSTITIGRDPSNSVFLNDMTVSRKHARLDIASDGTGLATIEDLGSLNGTWVDGAIVNKATLQDGSTIQIGTFRMVFHANRIKRIQTGA